MRRLAIQLPYKLTMLLTNDILHCSDGLYVFPCAYEYDVNLFLQVEAKKSAVQQLESFIKRIERLYKN